MKRKQFIKSISVVGASTMLPLSKIGSFLNAETIGEPPVACTLIPSETRGPFPSDGSYSGNLSLNRTTINEAQTGVAFSLTITVQNLDCTPIPNARVDIWHCNKSRLKVNTMTCFIVLILSSFSLLAQTTTVPDTGFVLIPRNPSFVFTTDLTNTASTGKASPIDSAYCMNKYLVTNAQYKAFVTATGYASVPSYWVNKNYPTGKADHPILNVSLVDAEAYCAWLGTLNTRWKFRMPTEAEWENAAKGPNKYAYPWGNSANTSYANGVLTTPFCYNGVCAAAMLATQGTKLATYNNVNSTLYNTQAAINTILSVSASGSVSGWIDHPTYTGFVYTNVHDSITASGGFTTPVGFYPQGISTYGCYDMAGNAFEWTSTLDTAKNGAEAGQYVNMIRGGSWYANGARDAKTSFRGEGRNRTGKYITVGFRVAASPKDATRIDDVAQIYDLKVYPNPITNELTIFDVQSTPFLKTVDLSIYNELGQLVLAKKIFENNAQTETIDVRHLNTGIYILNIRTENKRNFNQKLTITH